MVMHLTLTQNIEVRFFYPLPIFQTACRLFVQVSERDEMWRCNVTARHEGNSIVEVRGDEPETLVQIQFTFCHSRVFQ